MTYRVIPVEPFDYVVFGGTGDLAHRKLMPSLYQRLRDGQVPEGSRIIAASRSDLGDDAYRESIREALETFIPERDRDPRIVDRFLSMLSYVAVDATEEAGWGRLKEKLREDVVRAFYLAVAPSLFDDICEALGRHGLVHDRARVVIEKPVGRDLASAREVNRAVGKVFDEAQIFRIDHYLGKETVQNLMAVRFANVLFEPVWKSAYVDHVQITVAEDIGVGGRGDYYDRSGAMRDMVQNHLMQLLCLVAMEPPSSLDADAVRDEKLKVLKSLEPMGGNAISAMTVRGQYGKGVVDGQAVDGYRDETGIENSKTETFVAMKVEIGNWRWANVPFYLRTGKRLPQRVSEIVVAFKPVPHSIFPGDAGGLQPNRLVIRLQPDEAIVQRIMIKDPGPGGMRLVDVPLDMSFADAFEQRHPDAYERLLMDVVRGNQTLFMRRDEVEAAWAWVDPILEVWERSGEAPKPYTSGTWGPSAATALIERDGRSWYEDAA